MMNTGRIFIANLSKGKLGADKANLLGSLLTMQFQLGAMSRVNQPGLLDAVAAKRIAALDAELAGLKAEAARLAVEVEELTPAKNAGIVDLRREFEDTEILSCGRQEPPGRKEVQHCLSMRFPATTCRT